MINSGEAITVRLAGEAALSFGDRVALSPEDGRVHRFDAQGMAI